LKKVALDIDPSAKVVHSQMNVNIDTANFEETETRFNLRITAGGEKRKEATKNFLSKFTNVQARAQEENWINISIFVQSLTFQGKDIKEYLEKFREKLILYAEKHLIHGLSTFIRDFVVFKFFPQDYSATIIFEFKSDVYQLIKDSLGDLMFLRNFLTNNSTSWFDFDMKINSGLDLGDLIENSSTLGDFLKQSDIVINSTGIKSRNKALVMNLGDAYKQYLPLLQLLFVPNNMKVNYKGPIGDFQDSSTGETLKADLSSLKPILEFIRGNIDPNLLKVMSRLEIGLNLYDIFVNLQVFSTKMWSEK